MLAAFGAPLAFLVLLVAADWVYERYADPDKPRWGEAPALRNTYRNVAVSALEAFSRLPEAEQRAVRENLEANLLPSGQWLADLARSPYELVCIGEDHEEETRAFLAEEFFPRLPVDVLLLEATPDEIERIEAGVADGHDYVALLDADIATVIRAARGRNPALAVAGIEETEGQRFARESDTEPGLRDDSIAVNFWGRYRPAQRHAILYGALHCTTAENWLYRRIQTMAPAALEHKMLNVRVVGEHQDGPLEAFVYFLDELGVDRSSFAIPDTGALHPLVYQWFASVRRLWGPYRALLVFRA